MRRWLFNLFAILSLLLCIASAGLWVRSYWIEDWLFWPFAGCRVIASQNTRVIIDVYHRSDLSYQPFSYYETTTTDRWHAGQPTWRFGGFWIASELDARLFHTTTIAIPLYAITALTLLPPAIAVRGMVRRRRRAAAGLCPLCGYDLRATPDRCPECGQAP